MTYASPRASRGRGAPEGVHDWDAVTFDVAGPPLGYSPTVPDFGLDPPADRRPPADPFLPDGLGEIAPLAPPARRRGWAHRVRVVLNFALAVSLLLHSGLLVMLVGGTIAGAPEGKEAISVEVITQEQYDALLGEGSSEGGKPRKVDDSEKGADAIQQTLGAASPSKSDNRAERREAPAIVSAPMAPEALPSATSDRTNAAAADLPQRSERKAEGTGSQKESHPTPRTDPKERSDSERERVRSDAPPAPRSPGADGGEMRRVASHGGIGEEMGPLPPTMRQALMQLLQKQIEICYRPPGGENPANELPLLRIRFKKDGTLDGLPVPYRYERTATGKALAKAAVKAVRECAPYRMPPRFAPYYDSWKEIMAEFEFASR